MATQTTEELARDAAKAARLHELRQQQSALKAEIDELAGHFKLAGAGTHLHGDFLVLVEEKSSSGFDRDRARLLLGEAYESCVTRSTHLQVVVKPLG